MSPSRPNAAAAFALVVLASGAPAFGWSEIGHRAVASLAYERLSPEDRAAAADLLRRHPRFAEDFAAAMPQEAASGTDEAWDEWVFQQAACWPDVARGLPGTDEQGPGAEFSRPTWHYVNQPLYLAAADRDALADGLAANVSYEPPADAAAVRSMNVVQAVRHATAVVRDRSRPDAERALHLSWLFHLVGDVHQPLHSTALFSAGRFPEGDKGGNLIGTRPDGNLHAVWDRFPGGDGEPAVGTHADFLAARERAGRLQADAAVRRLGERAARERDPAAWTAESRELAIGLAYSPEVLAHVRASPPAAGEATPELRLSEEYLAAGRRASDRRLAAAGFRLAELLRGL